MRSPLSVVVAVLVSLASPCVAAPQPIIVRGIIEDQTSGLVPNATVELLPNGTPPIGFALTDNTGTFRFENVSPGSYFVRIYHDGFETKTVHLDVGSSSAELLRIVLQVSGFVQEITVNGTASQLDVADTENQDKVEITDHLLDDLPLFNQNYLAAVSSFLGPISVGNTGPSIVVDGLETPEIGVSPSAIQQDKTRRSLRARTVAAATRSPDHRRAPKGVEWCIPDTRLDQSLQRRYPRNTSAEDQVT